ncbi:hypothetical protein [Lutibacter sp.]|uniref:tetratricopeptide repeat protein n=1 Tax=Lutibacter sp. TaxID=1925666 RepID=UPI0025C1C20F|nr:hypothetical protein [Lutibacter sp.]MCF6169273.1 hypothetical protein [Lutibacter sp.]
MVLKIIVFLSDTNVNKSIELNPYISQYHIGALLYDIKNKKEKYLVKHLSEALRLSPDILASKFFLEFYKKYPIVDSEAQEIAIKELVNEIATKSSPVLKARLARLLLDKYSVKSFQLLKEVINLLPNMNRPWLYAGYLVENTKDSIEIEKYFKKSIFLRKKDFLPKLYYGKYLEEKEMDEKAISYFKEALESYESIKSPLYGQNRALSGLKIIPNSYLPNNLLYFLKPYVNVSQIFYFFENYYDKQNNEELKEYYKKLALKYENKIFKGEDKLR